MRPILRTPCYSLPVDVDPVRAGERAACGSGMWNSSTCPFAGFSRPTYELRWVEYQTRPCGSPAVSWAESSSRGNSYSVITTRVDLPCARGCTTKLGSLESGPRAVARKCANCASCAGVKRPGLRMLIRVEPAPWVMRKMILDQVASS